MFEIFNKYPNPMYSAYGFGIKKDRFYELGGRSVIYGPKCDCENLKKIGMDWRFEEFIPNERDYSWLREWRLKENEINLDTDNWITVVSKKQDEIETVLELDDVVVDGDVSDGEFVAYYYGKYERLFNCVNIEEIKRTKSLSSDDLDKLLSQCNKNEECYLGSKIISP